jgi:hypothetical protein
VKKSEESVAGTEEGAGAGTAFAPSTVFRGRGRGPPVRGGGRTAFRGRGRGRGPPIANNTWVRDPDLESGLTSGR